MEYRPADPDFEARVRGSFERQGFMRTLAARLVSVTPGACEIHVPYHEGLSQQHGFFHGGIVGTVADNAGGYAAYSLMPADASILTVEYKVNLLAPAEGDLLISRSRVVRAGRNLTVCESRVSASKEGVERPCAQALVTLMALHGQPDRPAADS